MHRKENELSGKSDFFPIIFLVILFGLAWIIPVMVPASLLHIWFWLRQRSNRSNLVAYVAVIAVVVGLFVVVPLAGNAYYARDGHGPEGLVRTRYLPGMLMMLVGTAIVPILFRLMGVGWQRSEADDFGPNTGDLIGIQPAQLRIRWGIGLALCIVMILIAGGMVDDPSRYPYSPTWSLIASFVTSLIGVVAMRINARCSHTQMVVNFVAVWLGGWLILKGTMAGIDTIVEWSTDGPDAAAGARWLWIRYREGWDRLASGGGMFAVAAFSLICRRYGWSIAGMRFLYEPNAVGRQRSDVHYTDQVAVNPAPKSWTAWIGATGGHVSILLIIAMLTLYPFTWTSEHDNSGYRVAGWPMTYWHAEQITPSSSPWYWSDPSVWRTRRWSTMALVVDVGITLVVGMTILPPTTFRRRFSGAIRATRWVTGLGLLLLIGWTAFLSPSVRNWQRSRITGVTVNEYQADGHFHLFERIAHEIDTQWRGERRRMQRGGPVEITIRDASSDEVDTILWAVPTVKRLSLQNCEMTVDRVTEWATNESFDRFRFEADDLKGFGIVGAARYGREIPYADGFTLEFTACEGDVFVPEGVDKLKLVIPHRHDSSFRIRGMADLHFIELQNLFGDVPDSVSRITIEEAPHLHKIRMDTMQRFALNIHSAPKLNTLVGFTNDEFAADARLTELNMSGPTDLGLLHLNLTNLTQLRLQFKPNRIHVDQVRLKVDASADPDSVTSDSLNAADQSPITNDEIERLVSGLQAIASTTYLELDGLICSDATLRRLPNVQRSLTLRRCILTQDVVDASYPRFESIMSLEIENLTATPKQIAGLRRCEFQSND